MSMYSLDVIKNSTLKNKNLYLPEIELTKKEYNEVKKILTKIGGKWKGGKTQAFVFEHDPKQLIERLINGEKINLKKDFQFFPTPVKIVKKLLEIANIQSGDKVLEPSAGQGAIINEVIKKGIKRDRVHYLEFMSQNRQKLKDIEATDIGEQFENDFLKMKASQYYDVVIANPPFTKDQDIDHVKHMWEMINDKGIVVSIMSQSWLKGRKKKQVEFRKWLKELGAEVIELSSGEFKESGTDIATCIVVLDKQNAFKSKKKKEEAKEQEEEIPSFDVIFEELYECMQSSHEYMEELGLMLGVEPKKKCLFCGGK